MSCRDAATTNARQRKQHKPKKYAPHQLDPQKLRRHLPILFAQASQTRRTIVNQTDSAPRAIAWAMTRFPSSVRPHPVQICNCGCSVQIFVQGESISSIGLEPAPQASRAIVAVDHVPILSQLGRLNLASSPTCGASSTTSGAGWIGGVSSIRSSGGHDAFGRKRHDNFGALAQLRFQRERSAMKMDRGF